MLVLVQIFILVAACNEQEDARKFFRCKRELIVIEFYNIDINDFDVKKGGHCKGLVALVDSDSDSNLNFEKVTLDVNGTRLKILLTSEMSGICKTFLPTHSDK